MTNTQKILLTALKNKYENVVVGKGGYFIKNVGFITTAQARNITGIAATEHRNTGIVMTAGGEWAWVAAINRQL